MLILITLISITLLFFILNFLLIFIFRKKEKRFNNYIHIDYNMDKNHVDLIMKKVKVKYLNPYSSTYILMGFKNIFNYRKSVLTIEYNQDFKVKNINIKIK